MKWVPPMQSKCTMLNTQYFYIFIIYIFLNQKLQPTKIKTPNFYKVPREFELNMLFAANEEYIILLQFVI